MKHVFVTPWASLGVQDSVARCAQVREYSYRTKNEIMRCEYRALMRTIFGYVSWSRQGIASADLRVYSAGYPLRRSAQETDDLLRKVDANIARSALIDRVAAYRTRRGL